ncbi:phage tail fiber protein [Nocardiopsis synnemataformans]|uniref:phage tail fiber protein n=1 Tax=Nocardiopsis synnemataformans TaxID=61305 RepID=UPI003EC12551
MASSFSVLARDPAVQAAAAAAVEVSLHSAEPDGTGSNELVGGAYARRPVAWGASASGIVTATTEPEFDVPGGNWVRWCGLWDVNGAWVGGIELNTKVEYPADGTYTISPLRLHAENFVAA